MDHILRIAEVLYGGLCRQIGTPTEVAIRRDVKDMEEMIMKSFYNKRGCVLINSGSYREGFRFSSSDMDTMLWWCKYKLITDISQAEVYSSSKHNIILIEDSDTPPGFVRLQLLTSTRNDFVISCLASFNGGYYISSSLWTERHFQIFSKVKRNQTQNFTNHGPCTSGFYGPIEFDHAICFSTLFWPKTFNVWIDRCLRYIWPSAPVMEKILRNGCHCVPIGSKIVSTSNELEWRLSFSQAEQQLVYNMNHTQFLCYGLLKIFSKEVINHREEPLLCSYYLKTTMFWMIQLGHFRWCPNNLLNCFWKCFKYLIHCVYRGVFPNFFVPQNNMFKNKVVGDARDSLLQQLYQYYRMGVSCLLLSPTLRPFLELALSSPFVVLSSDVGEMIDISTTDMCCKFELSTITFHIEHISHSYLFLKSVDTLSQLSLSPIQSLTFHYCAADILVRSAFTIANNTSCFIHKRVYILDRMVCNILKLASRLGPVSCLLYLALYYYRTGKYDKTFHITVLTKQRMSQSVNMYRDTTDRQRYNETLRHLSITRRMKIAWISNVLLFENIPCITELCLEQKASQHNGESYLYLSPLVTVEMLSVLSRYRLGNKYQCLQSLKDLQKLLLYDDGTYVPLKFRDISWQILGICQHMVGDLHGALQSYEESLRQEPFHGIQEATNIRIRSVKQHLHEHRNLNM
ncbi:uncharacterized protein LOC133188269 [Saccostrea echinata]|uniref:uncharacterized protein LOC133188269 n=1 Tax=Saccostrea echinata TaxID=191078 RepID=UPI002A7F8460|nr:uncharacterized protein LOC133188269 [Saccostrea echinata]